MPIESPFGGQENHFVKLRTQGNLNGKMKTDKRPLAASTLAEVYTRLMKALRDRRLTASW